MMVATPLKTDEWETWLLVKEEVIQWKEWEA